MRRLIKRIYTLKVFIIVGRLLFTSSRFKSVEIFSLGLARFYAWTVTLVHGKNHTQTPQKIAEEWRRLMPTPHSHFPIVGGDDRTAYMEIRIHCPLRGSGDPLACWRSMEFDRALMRGTGGRLLVMESQSVTGNDFCRLAIRRENDSFDDLPVAHPRWLQEER